MLQWWLILRWSAQAYADTLARVDFALVLIGGAMVAYAIGA
jgi:hypothetical protein